MKWLEKRRRKNLGILGVNMRVCAVNVRQKMEVVNIQTKTIGIVKRARLMKLCKGK
jgi:hypothetical protein